jgi:sialate O-acetylesterase
LPKKLNLPLDPRTDPNVNYRLATGLYNGTILPLVPLAIKGVIWYQGEHNTDRPVQYRKLLPALITCWRQAWGRGDFPFLIVQLPNYYAQVPDPQESAWAATREAQCMALTLPNTGMAVTIDVGEAASIHPLNKMDVGKRLALVALGKVYEQKIEYSGPMYDRMEAQNDTIRLRFTHVGRGLAIKGGGPLKGFAICGDDRKFVWADAIIAPVAGTGLADIVVVRSDKVAKPVAVRYAWANNPVCNLTNDTGLPACPFRTDNW